MGFRAEIIDMPIRSSNIFWKMSEIFGARFKNIK